ncbi:MAG TPA: DinB family protein [Gemmatimonadales bacterium]|nr:DinB family protein [Gemmatimonadales bacterium]
MTATAIARPEATEYAPYYGTYVSKVPAGDLLQLLERQRADTQALLAGLSDERALHRYAPGKWSIKEVVGHIADAERIFSYRALRIARGDETPLPGFDENAYTPAGHFDARPLAELAAELDAVRRATIALFRGLEGDALVRRGTASNHGVSVRALAYIIAGHERHHVQILRERYLQ